MRNGERELVYYGIKKTTVYETSFHRLQAELGIENLDEIIIRERAVYDVHCEAALVGLTHSREFHSQLTANTYDFTQPLGRRIHREGHPGLLAPSIRYSEGKNAVIFNKNILNAPKVKCSLTYRLNSFTKEIKIERTPEKLG